MDHHAAQRALVRMLYDPAFAEEVRRAPERTGLPADVSAALGAIDPRALRADPLRRRRTLGTLIEEFRASSTLALDEVRRIDFLEGFFSAPEFHRAVEERAPLVLAYGAFLARACAEGRLRRPVLPDVVRLEHMQARTRREARPVVARPDAPSVRLAPGVMHARLSPSALEAVQRVEQLLFEWSLLPQLALCDDGPRLALGDPAPDREPLLVVPTASGISLVTPDAELDALLGALGESTLARHELARRASSRMAPARAEALIAELLDDEVLEGIEDMRA
jgi:hypothetical protein